MHLQKIDIDWDIHRLIEGERRGFDEPPYMALRRLLKLPELSTSADSVETSGIDWSEDGVRVPHGSHARMSYLRGRQVYEGRFLNGKLIVNGQSFDTLSAAASALAVTKDGNTTNLNGWNYWEARFPGENKWRSLKEMRDEVRKE
ncbi:hypothetical protein [Mesorhizobium koreense]|uniref:hypothetical protein n=1 Tax=Mesorhizobium koreense TaxID=3074855 RepID=UPI00287BA1AE|nr:hypothetical protein [Mesorhizobium sp. WR6]